MTLKRQLPLYLLLAALFLGVIWRGAYFPAGKTMLAVLLLLSGALELMLNGKVHWRSFGFMLLTLFGALAAVGLLWSEAPAKTERELLLLAGYLAAYLVVQSQLKRSPVALARIAVAWVYLATMVAAWGVASYLLRLEPYATVLDGLLRAGSTFEYSNALSCFALMSLPVTVALRRGAKAADRSPLSLAMALQVAAVLLGLSRFGLLVLAVMLLALLAVSYRRGEFLQLFLAICAGLAVALAALILLVRGHQLIALAAIIFIMAVLAMGESWARTAGQGRGSKLFAVLLAGIGLAVLSVALALSEGARFLVVRRFWQGFAWEKLLPHRLDTFAGAASAFRAHPWRGSGLGSFAEVYQQYAVASYTKFAHNLLLQAAVETGILGAVALGAWLLYAAALSVWSLLGARSQPQLLPALAAAVLVFIAYNLFDWEWYVPALTGWFIVAVASLEALSNTEAAAPEDGA